MPPDAIILTFTNPKKCSFVGNWSDPISFSSWDALAPYKITTNVSWVDRELQQLNSDVLQMIGSFTLENIAWEARTGFFYKIANDQVECDLLGYIQPVNSRTSGSSTNNIINIQVRTNTFLQSFQPRTIMWNNVTNTVRILSTFQSHKSALLSSSFWLATDTAAVSPSNNTRPTLLNFIINLEKRKPTCLIVFYTLYRLCSYWKRWSWSMHVYLSHVYSFTCRPLLH